MTATYLGFAALLTMIVSGTFWIRAVLSVSLPKDRSAYVISWAAAALLGVAALAGGPGLLGGIPAGLATVVGCFGLLTVTIGDQKLGVDAIRVGQQIPEFSALDEKGETFDSASLAGRPVLIKFFRAHW